MWKIKCRDCLFISNDIMKLYEHIKDLGHKDFALMDGNTVKVDWIHMEVKREEPK